MYQIEENLLKLAYAKGISSQGKWALANWMMQYPYKEIGFEDIVKIGKSPHIGSCSVQVGKKFTIIGTISNRNSRLLLALIPTIPSVASLDLSANCPVLQW